METPAEGIDRSLHITTGKPLGEIRDSLNSRLCIEPCFSKLHPGLVPVSFKNS